MNGRVVSFTLFFLNCCFFFESPRGYKVIWLAARRVKMPAMNCKRLFKNQPSTFVSISRPRSLSALFDHLYKSILLCLLKTLWFLAHGPEWKLSGFCFYSIHNDTCTGAHTHPCTHTHTHTDTKVNTQLSGEWAGMGWFCFFAQLMSSMWLIRNSFILFVRKCVCEELVLRKCTPCDSEPPTREGGHCFNLLTYNLILLDSIICAGYTHPEPEQQRVNYLQSGKTRVSHLPLWARHAAALFSGSSIYCTRLN